MPSIPRLVQGLLLAIALSSTFAQAQSTSRQFFKPHAATLAKSGSAVKAPGVVSDAVPVEFNAPEMLGLTPGEEIALTLPDATSRTVVFELAQDHGGGIRSWVGYLKDLGNDNRVIVTTGPSGSYGTIDTPGGGFRIVPGDGHDWLVDMKQEQRFVPAMNLGDDGRMPPPELRAPYISPYHATYSAAVPGVNRVGFGKVTPMPLANIDMMFVVTRTLADRLGAGLLTRLNFMVTRANTSYADSEVGVNLRLVNVTVVDYTDGGSNGTALDAITPGRAPFDAATFGAIETIRAQANADMVSLLRSGGSFSGSGIAWVGSTSPNPLIMYSVTTGCVAGCESVWIHEVGHNMGNMHDRATVAWQKGGTTTYAQGAQPYAYGYVYCKSGALTCDPTLTNGTAGACPAADQPECSTSDSSNFRTIMSYFQGTTNGLYRFSNPALLNCKAPSPGDGVNRACGIVDTATGIRVTDGSADAAKSMNTTRTPISALKPGATNPPGILQFTNTGFSGAESGGSIAFTVGRSNGSGGAVSLSYSTAGGSATSGTDFTASSGTLSWGDGDVANKTITVTLTTDALAEGIETFTVTLSNPIGGASLGHPTTATGSILEPWPPGGSAPPGFSSLVTPSLPWAPATDSFDGTVDSVSFKSGAFTSSATGNSSTQFTGNFDAGAVAFAYRVSSYPGAGFFEFLIDNVVIVSDSGDSGWKSFSTAITAGNHTLEWRYRKTRTFFCANAIPAPPQGAACADRAWIDTVSLPLEGSTLKFALTVTKTGGGVGTVSSTPTGISCGATCSANFNSGTAVTLTANPATGSTFDGWSGGGCTGIGNCSVTLNAAASVSAAFSDTTGIPRLVNIATRAKVQTGSNVLIAGFIIGGTKPKKVLITARGQSVPVLPSEVPLLMADPKLTLYSGATPIASNDDWQNLLAPPSGSPVTLLPPGDIPATQKPGNSLDAAIFTTLAPGAYTGIVEGFGGSTGLAIVEVFEVDLPDVPLINIATRGRVEPGANVMIAGFIIQGNAAKKVLVTARGQSVAVLPSEVPLLMADPKVTLYSGATPIASNDDWQTLITPPSGSPATLLPPGDIPATQKPGNAKDSAILTTLAPGAYTAIVEGVGSTSGIAIVEVFAQ